jgi:hypothetical protein
MSEQHEEVQSEQNNSEPSSTVSLDVTRMGLPLSKADNFKCFLVIVLAIMLQIRFHNTIFAEGIIAFSGFIGYVIFRYWLLRLRYPEVGSLVLNDETIELPPCLYGKTGEKIAIADTRSLTFYLLTGRGNGVLSSFVILRGVEKIKINWLATDLSQLKIELKNRNINFEIKEWNLVIYLLIPVLLAFGFLLIKLFLME